MNGRCAVKYRQGEERRGAETTKGVTEEWLKQLERMQNQSVPAMRKGGSACALPPFLIAEPT
jgi:hypothetical protein